ncbi:MAG: hypothetical protein M3R04_07560 [bacterium]|nr:hypothetical protein [bacterium]
MMKQEQDRKRRYKQFAGFPGFSGTVEGTGSHGPKPVPPLTDAERAAMSKLGIPHTAEVPRAYAPPLGPHTRRIGIELLGPLGLAAVVLTLFTWLLTVPASGESSYYSKLIDGSQTKVEPYPLAHHADEHHAESESH